MSLKSRIYVPLSVAEFETLRQGSLQIQADGEPQIGHMVTEQMRREQPEADEEELEFEATHDAVYTAAHNTPGQRVIVAALDHPKMQILSLAHGSAQQLTGLLSMANVACWYVSTETLTTASIDALEEEPDLQWFAPEESAAAKDLAVKRKKARSK